MILTKFEFMPDHTDDVDAGDAASDAADYGPPFLQLAIGAELLSKLEVVGGGDNLTTSQSNRPFRKFLEESDNIDHVLLFRPV